MKSKDELPILNSNKSFISNPFIEYLLDAKFINPVLTSIVNILETMANMKAQPGKPSLKSDNNSLGEVSGIIDMNGQQVKGSIAISFSKPVVLDIAKRMLREEFHEIDNEVQDLVGEITNMMVGGAKAKLADEGFNFELSTPKIFAQPNHQIKHSTEGPIILLPFRCDNGEFFVEICLV